MPRPRKISPQQVDAAMKADNQYDAFIAVYRLVYPNWDRIASLDGWPTAGAEVSTYVHAAFIAFDKVHHPEVMAGGLWFNRGWSTDKNLPPWSVLPAPATMQVQS